MFVSYLLIRFLTPCLLLASGPMTGTFLASGPDTMATRRTTSLTLTKDHRFRFVSRKKPGPEGNEYAGTFRWDDGILALTPEYDETHEDFPRMPTRWRLVPWGRRDYLIPTGKIITFCNAVNLGTEPSYDPSVSILMYEKDWGRPVSGKPELPLEWSDYLLDEPIRGTLIDIDDEGFGKLDVGGNQGLAGGMVLIAHTFDRVRACRLKVICPCQDNATVELLPIDTPGHPATGLIDVQPGDEVATTLELPEGYPLGDLPKIIILKEPEKNRRIKEKFPRFPRTLAVSDRSRFDSLWKRVLPRVVLHMAGRVPIKRIESAKRMRWTVRSDGGERLLYQRDPTGMYETKEQLLVDACVFNRKTGVLEAVYVTRKNPGKPSTSSRPTGSRPPN